MCQTCVDQGYLAQDTFDLLEAFGEAWPDASYGPAHITIDDANVTDSNLAFCRRLVLATLADSDAALLPYEREIYRALRDDYQEHDPNELWATLGLLELLQLVPEEAR